MYGIVNGKIAKRKNKTGWSWNFLMVKNKRNPMTGKAGYDVIWNFGTVRSTEVKDRANAFWKEVELVLNELVRTGKIYRNDADKIRKQFDKYIPIPVVPKTAHVHAPIVPIAKPKAQKNNSPAAEQRIAERFKDLL